MKTRSFALPVMWAVALVFAAPALAGDLNPPPWPRDNHDMKKTYQCWTFPTNQRNGIPPDDGWSNFHGTPHADILPVVPPIPGGDDGSARWLPEFAGRSGVWCLGPGDMMAFTIPNWYMPPPFYKDIWIQIKYLQGPPIVDVLFPGVMGGTVPNVSLPASRAEGADGRPIDYPLDPLAPGGWRQGVWQVRLPYCPDFEVIKITSNPNLYIDQVCIDTWCVPTPGAAGLLAMAGLLVARRRR